MRVLVIDTIAPEGIAHLKERGFRVDLVASKLAPDRLHERIADYEAIITRSSTAVSAEFLARARKLRILGRAGKHGERIVRLKDLHIEFIPEGHILVLSYEDRPGMVGRIGSILGRHNVNIASMHVGRRTKRGRAIVVLRLDEDVPPDVMEEVEKAVEADFVRLIRIEP